MMDISVFQTILASMGEGLVFADQDDTIRFINAAAEKIRGIRAHKFLGRQLLDMHTPRARAPLSQLLIKLKKGELNHSTRTIRVKKKFFENTYYPIRNSSGVYTGTLMVSRDVTEKSQLKDENEKLRRQLLAGEGLAGMMGKSAAMKTVFKTILATAKLDSTMLITGESGTGKELVARALHELSTRKNGPMININCAALPENLLEAELFGYEKGSFTGAGQARSGKFEQADGGTLFLDEIGEMSLSAQTKLLRVLQEKKVQRIGGEKEIRINVRIVAATNRDLREEMEKGHFREDLFFRLNVIPVQLPPLRERREDILPLANLFLAKFSTAMHKPLKKMRKETIQALLRYPFPGNIRELENVLERAVALCQDGDLAPEDLPDEITRTAATVSQGAALMDEGLTVTMQHLEQQIVSDAIRRANGRKNEAAKLLKISRKTLWEKLKKWQEA
nr:sigma 54-interacting transcriptional regulator [uncultured Desulfuromonas sp.]